MLRTDLSQGCKILAAFNDQMHEEPFRAGAQHLIAARIVSKKNLALLNINISLAPLTGQLLVELHRQRLLTAQTKKTLAEKLTSKKFRRCCELLNKHHLLSFELYFKLVNHKHIETVLDWLSKNNNSADKNTVSILENYLEQFDNVQRLITKFQAKDWCVDTVNQLQREHPKRLRAITTALNFVPDRLLDKESVLFIAGIEVRQDSAAKALAVLLAANIATNDADAINFILSISIRVDAHPMKHFIEIENDCPELDAARFFVILKNNNLHTPDNLHLLLENFQNESYLFKDLVKLETWIKTTRPKDIHLILQQANHLRNNPSVTMPACLFGNVSNALAKPNTALEAQDGLKPVNRV